MMFTAAILITIGLLFRYMDERFEASAHRSPAPAALEKPKATRDTVGKVTYDPIADGVLVRVNERRRQQIPDSGLRRRSTDKR